MTPAGFLESCVETGLALLVLAAALAVVRLVRGPGLPDRVVALDFLAVALVSFCGLLALRTGVRALLDVALVLALVGFLATVAFARFAERNAEARQDGEDDA
jgi:multicomponent Na+:H+ antiporter subunit F